MRQIATKTLLQGINGAATRLNVAFRFCSLQISGNEHLVRICAPGTHTATVTQFEDERLPLKTNNCVWTEFLLPFA